MFYQILRETDMGAFLSLSCCCYSGSHLYVANGSHYQIEVSYSDSKEETHERSSSFTVSGLGVSAEKSASQKVASQKSSIIVGIGDVALVPESKNCVSVSLIAAEGKRPLVNNWEIDRSGKSDKSIIITEYGTVQFGYGDTYEPNDDWKWISSDGGTSTNHRPRKFFVANASGKNITVQHVTSDGTPVGEDQCVSISHGHTSTIDFDCVKITIEGSNKQPPRVFKAVPRTSLVVCRDHNVRDSTQLYGESIRKEKWIVDDENYKPYW